MTVSMVKRCHETDTHPITFEEIWSVIRSGKHDLKERITQIRNRYEAERDITGDPVKAKKSISDLKLDLPGFLPSGTFSKRENGALVEYSGLLCADLDSLGDRLIGIRDILKTVTFVRAIALSPSGDGLKVFFNVINDPTRHVDSFRSIQENVRNTFGVEIDEKCKDLARICFFTYDPGLDLREDGNEILPPADPLPRGRTVNVPLLTSADVNMPLRERILAQVLNCRPQYWPEKNSYKCPCPGEHLHTNKTLPSHCMVYLDGSPTIVCQHNTCDLIVRTFEQKLRSDIGKAEWESRVSHPLGDTRSETLSPNGSQPVEAELDSSYFSLSTPKTFSSFIPDAKHQLIGDYHIVKDKGFVFAIGGPPGCGKSLATVSLGIAGSKGEGEWFGMTVHRKFKTLIIQTENGLFRLSRIFKELDCDSLEDYLRVSEPPPYGLLFQRSDFRALVAKAIAEFAPDVVLLDPWNSVARDQEQRTYLDTFSLVRSVLPTNDTPALGIVAHTRKPQTDERASGRALMHLLAGSHVLVTVPRTVFVLQPASDDTEDNQVVWTCCKNNDGVMGKRTAWERKIGLFEPVPKFDWATFDASAKDKRVVITAEMVEEVFEKGELIRSLARDKLLEISGASKSAVYKALLKDGRFADNLIFKDDTINWLRK
jgi:VirE N-terminal domain/AAA domain